jgi:pyruvate carboxylase
VEVFSCRAWEQKYSSFTAMLPTKAFLAPMDEDEEIEVDLAKGNTVVLKYKALSELQPNGRRRAPCLKFPCVQTVSGLAGHLVRVERS